MANFGLYPGDKRYQDKQTLFTSMHHAPVKKGPIALIEMKPEFYIELLKWFELKERMRNEGRESK